MVGNWILSNNTKENMKHKILQYSYKKMILEVKLENLLSVKVLSNNIIVLISKNGVKCHYGFPNSKDKYRYIDFCKEYGIFIDYSQL